MIANYAYIISKIGEILSELNQSQILYQKKLATV